MIRRWTVRSHYPRTGLPWVEGGTLGRYFTFIGALQAAGALNRRLTERGPDDPIYTPEWRRHPDVAREGRGRMGTYGPSRIIRARIKLWQAARFHKKVAARLRKVAP